MTEYDHLIVDSMYSPLKNKKNDYPNHEDNNMNITHTEHPQYTSAYICKLQNFSTKLRKERDCKQFRTFVNCIMQEMLTVIKNILVIVMILLVISGVEQNPGPRKGRKKLTARPQKVKKHEEYKKKKEALSNEDLQTSREKSAQQKRNWRDSQSETTKENYRILDRDGRKRRRGEDTYRAEEKELDMNSKRRCRSNSVKRDKERKRDLKARQNLRSNEDYRQNEKKIDLKSKQNLRSNEDYRENEKKIDLKSKQNLRSNEDYRENEKKRDLKARQSLRSNEDYRENEKKTDLKSKQNLRSNEEYRENEKKRDLKARQNLRSNEDYREYEKKRDLKARQSLRSNEDYRENEKKTDLKSKHNLRSNEDYRENEKNRDLKARQSLRSNEDYREYEKKRDLKARQSLRSNEDYRENEKKIDFKSKQNLRSNEEYRENEKKRDLKARQNLRSNEDYREYEKKRDLKARQSLRSNEDYRENEKKIDLKSKQNLRSNEDYRENEKKRDLKARQSLRSNEDYRENEKKIDLKSKLNLRSNEEYTESERKNQKGSKRLLRADRDYREIENLYQAAIKRECRSDIRFREEERKTDADSKRALRRSSEYKDKERQSKEKQAMKKKGKESEILFVKHRFKESIQKGPVHVCTCCKRLLYRHSVVHVPGDHYRKYKVTKELISKCLTGHLSAVGSEWICNTCHKAIKGSRMPAQAESNMLNVEEQPFELSNLSPLEERLIARRIPFMQIVNLPRGSQKGIKGPAVNVPSSLDNVVSLLPRLPSSCGLVPVKLKRKLEYRGHVMYQSIRPASVMQAITYLKLNNKQYEDVDINSKWIQDSCKEDDELAKCLIEDYVETDSESYTDSDSYAESDSDRDNYGESDSNNDRSSEDIKAEGYRHVKQPTLDEKQDVSNATGKAYNDREDEDDEDSNVKLRGIPYNTCLQPSSLSYTGKEIFSLAPGEGQIPVSFFTDPECETLAFPSLFPSGRFGLNSKNRTVNLTMRRYFNQRMLNVNNRYAQNIEYLFFAQYLCEAKQVIDGISIAMRKGARDGGKQLTAGFLSNTTDIENELKRNDGFRFLQNVRGSYPYWVKTLHDLNAMVRQLDIPTWFCSFSAADLKWPETIRVIAEQQGQLLSDEDVESMDWQQKCFWLRSNPVTAARHFEFRVNKFLHEVLLTPAQPLGKIKDYFIRTEFQQRGSPHIHCLFWVEGAPKLDKDSDEVVCQFIDKYVTAELPDDDDDIYELVSTVQKHSHSSSCGSQPKKCRFHFPRPPTLKTIIAAPPDQLDVDPLVLKKDQEKKMTILKRVQDAVVDNSERSLEDILVEVKLTEEQYMDALKTSVSNPTVILKRMPWETCINNYNSDLLQIWSANLDIQFVINAYACAMYILSYVSKGERQMGELLKSASKECSKDDSIRQQMKKLGNVFFTHRELSAQEAAYRLLSIPLKKCSRAVVFVNTGLPADRTHILKPLYKLQSMPEDSTNIFELSITDRYSARPNHMESVCLADFATLYRLKGTKEGDNQDDCEDADAECDGSNDKDRGKEVRLKNNSGIMVKRKTRAILRSPRFSSLKTPELYFHSHLMLYYPWRNEDDLKGECNLYKEFFEEVKDEVTEKQMLFENNSEEFDAALDSAGNLSESAWDQLASEQEHQRCDETQDGKKSEDLEAEEYIKNLKSLPELGSTSTKEGFSVEYTVKQLTDDEYYDLVKSLNSGQRDLFDEILKWCRHKVKAAKTTSAVPAFYTFLTGGAGTGKSHLIRGLVNMIDRELKPQCDSPDKPIVLLTAPTGIAAANIDGMTIHHALSIPVRGYNKNEDPAISQEKLAALRNSLEYFQVLIIDEISMVGVQLFNLINKRLNQIKGVSNPDVVFGGISVLAVGDFYQINPVKQHTVYSLPLDPYQRLNPVHLWKDYFRIVELTEVMRQKDDANFCNLLNRIRLGQKYVTEEDEAMLRSRIRCPTDEDYPHDALHVYTTNELVNTYNREKLSSLKNIVKVLPAVDCKKDLHTKKVVIKQFKSDQADTGGLCELLELAVDARVMLIKNIDVSDRLVNGAQGTVVGFINQNEDENKPVIAVLVRFDDCTIGQQLRKNYPVNPKGAVPIFQQESVFLLSSKGAIEVTRKQFPLKLAFATTIHKVQGLSLDKVVVSFQRTFRGGQAYVALSRAKTLDGLYLQGFDKTKIITNTQITEEMQRIKTCMPFKKSVDVLKDLSDTKWMKVSHINVRSLLKHKDDLSTYTNLLSSDVIAVTETWLNKTIGTAVVGIPGFTFYRRDREECYRHHKCSAENCQKCNFKGGVGIYVQHSLKITMLPQFTSSGCETLYCCVSKKNEELYLCVVYRPQHTIISQIVKELSPFISYIKVRNAKAAIIGDFNIDWTNISMNKFLVSHNFTQLIEEPTHISGSTIDHIYVNSVSDMLQYGTIPCYFSDHSAIYCVLPTPGDQSELNSVVSKCSQHISKHGEDVIKRENKKPTIQYKKFTRKSFLSQEKSKATKSTTDENNNELVITTTEKADRIFLQNIVLPTTEDSRIVADYLRVTMQHDPVVNHEVFDIRYRGYLKKLLQHTVPCILDATEPDGNCFFRAISKQLLGTEKYHHRIRNCICNFEEAHLNTFVNWLGQDMSGLKRHISKMRHLRQWATEVELLATATFFDTSIWEFTEHYPYGTNNWQWIKLQKLEIHQDDPPYDGIPLQGHFYIHHTWGVHYDCVFPDPESTNLESLSG